MCVCVCVSMVIIVVGGTYIIANIYAIPIPYANFTRFVHIAHAAVIQSHKTSHLVEFEMSNLVFVWTIIQNVEVQSTWNKQCECVSYRNLMQNHHMQKQSAPKTFAFCIDNEPWPEHKRFTIMFHVCIRCVRVRVRWPYYTLNVAHWLAQPDRVCGYDIVWCECGGNDATMHPRAMTLDESGIIWQSGAFIDYYVTAWCSERTMLGWPLRTGGW